MSNLHITQMLVPPSKYSIKCPFSMDWQEICIHNTANRASAMSEISYMIGNAHSTSYHYAVDDYRAVQGLPLNRNGWHAGDGGNGRGNRTSIGIEICYSIDKGDKRYPIAQANAAILTAKLLKSKNFGVNRIKIHRDYSGKYCPHRMLDNGHWDAFFKAQVQAELDKLNGKTPTPVPSKPTQPEVPTQVKYYEYPPGVYEVLPEAGLNIRTKPDVGNVVKAVPKGTRFNAVEQIRGGVNGVWLKRDDGNYMSAQQGNNIFVKRIGNLPSSAPASKNTLAGLYKVNAGSLNIRTGPGVQNRVVGVITDRGTYTVTEVKDGWGRLKSGLGWISLAYCSKIGQSASAKPIETSRKGTFVVGVNLLNVRSGPSTSYPVVAQYKRGGIININSTVSQNGYIWGVYKSYSGKTRYVALETLSGTKYGRWK